MKTRFYSGIGSRAAPHEALIQCTKIAEVLETLGFILRSGGAEGADKAFESGVKNPSKKVIFRPKHCNKAAEEIASRVHPAWGECNDYVRQLHGRNAQIVLGLNLDTPSEFVVAWTFDGVSRGGTRTGLVLAKKNKIPTFNLADKEEAKLFGKFLVKLTKTS
jgi:hypothetical protein